MIDGRLWWEQSSDYWELPFYAEAGLIGPSEQDDRLAAREQLYAIREGLAEFPELVGVMMQEAGLKGIALQ